MKRHAFNQAEILMLGRTKRGKDAAWSDFERLCSRLNLHTKLTGGNFLTHEIDCSEDDFNALIELLAGK